MMGATAYVVNQTSDSVSVLDVRKRAVVGEFPVGRRPTHAVLAPDGRHLFVTSTWSQSVEVVEVASHLVTRSIRAGGQTIQPTSQPIMRNSFEAEPMVMVRSARPGRRAGCT